MIKTLNSFFLRTAILGLFFIFFLTFWNKVKAEDYVGRKIVNISVKGNRTIKEQSILNRIRLIKGGEYSSEVLKNDFKRLYKTGFYKDIKIDLQEEEEGISLTFIIEENTRIKEIEFTGNSKIKKKELLDALKELPKEQRLRLRKPYHPENLNINIQKIKDLYEEKGYYFAEVVANETYKQEKSYVKIKFNIKEGGPTKIRKIDIFGNNEFSEEKILKEIQTWNRYMLFFHDRVFQEEVFEDDLKRIIYFYDRYGYINARIKSHEIDEKKESYKWGRFTVSNTWLDISIHVEEGEKYYFDEVDFAGITKFSKDKASEWKEIRIGRIFEREVKKGDIYSNYRVNEIIENIKSSYSELGYIYCQVNPKKLFNEEKKYVSVLFEIAEGIQVYLEKIKIRGNKTTKDKVIRREFKIYPGDIFNGKLVRRSVQKIFNLGYFGDINVDTQPGEFRDKLNLLVKVEEKATGRFMAGIGYSSVDKILGQISLTKDNLFGNGQKISLNWELGAETQKYEFSFTDPYVFDSKILFGFDIYNTQREIYGEEDIDGDGIADDTAYSYKKKGWAIRLGRSFSDYVRSSIRYNSESGTYRQIGNDPFPLDVQAEDVSTRSLGLTLTRDSRDNYFFTTEGSINTWTVTYAGGFLGGTNNFVKNTGESRWHFLTIKDFVLVSRTRVGYVDRFDGSTDVPAIEKFDVGGAYTVRGYTERKIAEGKKTMLIVNLEYMVPLTDQLRGLIFWDAGNAWDELKQAKLSELRHGAGIGMRIDTPVFPIMLDYGWGFNEGGEKRGLFHFNLGFFF